MVSACLPEKTPIRLTELAQVLDKHVSTIVRWTQRGVKGQRLRSYLIGGQRYVDREDVLVFLRALNDQRTGTDLNLQPRREEIRCVEEKLNRAGF
jgi:hypothetical protein